MRHLLHLSFRRINLAWAARFGLLLALSSLIAAPRARAVLPPVSDQTTREPKLCVHTRLIDEVFEWRIAKSLDMAQQMGATAIVEFFPWAYAEDVAGQFNWRRFDLIIRYARHFNLRVIARLGLVPAWARQSTETTSTLNTLPITAEAAFANFAAQFAARYESQVEALIIWNEPNLAFEWGYEPVDPQRYLRLMQTVYPAVKAAAPNIRVLTGALAPTLEPPGSPHGWNDLLYLTALYAGGLAEVSDGLAVHTYGFTRPADDPPAPDVLNFRRVELLRRLMEQHSAGDQPVYITETGWNDHPRWSLSVAPSKRVRYTLDALDIANEWPWLESLCLWVLRTTAPTNSYPDGFTLVTSDFDPRPLYLALQARAFGTLQDELWLPSPRASQ
jgi:hypothetical protein